jgi:putative transcriptional regulator
MIKCRLSRLLGDKRMSILELKRRTELSYVTLQNLYHEKTTGVAFDTIDKICESLECDIGDLLEYVEETE